MPDTFTLYGAAGTGSVIVEAQLHLLNLPYTVADPQLDGDYDAALEAVEKTNPMRQLPALKLPSGELMTESAAILIWLTETYGDGAFAPQPGDPRRPAFLRWMTFISAQIYAHYWARDDASRVVSDAAQEPVVRQRLNDRIVANWAVLDAAVTPDPYVLGEQLTPLDLYVAVMSRWGPGRARFHDAAPKLGALARRLDSDSRLVDFWARRFPFPEGWVG
jgi:GST-like protein